MQLGVDCVSRDSRDGSEIPVGNGQQGDGPSFDIFCIDPTVAGRVHDGPLYEWPVDTQSTLT